MFSMAQKPSQFPFANKKTSTDHFCSFIRIRLAGTLCATCSPCLYFCINTQLGTTNNFHIGTNDNPTQRSLSHNLMLKVFKNALSK